ncbi:MAG: acyltransferase [Candidatus Thorarchaeota archaeon]
MNAEYGGAPGDITPINIMKTVAILLVMLDHSMTSQFKESVLVSFWEQTAVPLFLVIMGFNAAGSLRRRGVTSVSNRTYMRRRMRRYLSPLVVFFAVASPITLARCVTDQSNGLSLDQLPVTGPGVWFVPVALSSVFVLPILHGAYRRRPRRTMVACMVNDLMHQAVLYGLTIAYADFRDLFRFLVLCSVTAYLTPIVLGFWFSDGVGLSDRRNWFVYPLCALSLSYMAIHELTGLSVVFFMTDYNVAVMPYSAMLFLLGMRLLPGRDSGLVHGLFVKTGRATFHILLTQAAVFSAVLVLFPDGFLEPDGLAHGLTLYAGIASACVAIGTCWLKVEQRLCTSQRLGTSMAGIGDQVYR